MSTAVATRPPTRRALTEPHLIDMPSERMAVAETYGDPNKVGKEAIQALYGAVYTYKFAEKKLGRDFKVKPLRARWSNLKAVPAAKLHGVWGIPVPAGTPAVPQKQPSVKVLVDTWRYGKVAEILHLGPYSAEPSTISRLLAFIHDQGYEVVGPHEEEYLSRPDARVPKTLIRYRVRKR